MVAMGLDGVKAVGRLRSRFEPGQENGGHHRHEHQVEYEFVDISCSGWYGVSGLEIDRVLQDISNCPIIVDVIIHTAM